MASSSAFGVTLTLDPVVLALLGAILGLLLWIFNLMWKKGLDHDKSIQDIRENYAGKNDFKSLRTEITSALERLDTKIDDKLDAIHRQQTTLVGDIRGLEGSLESVKSRLTSARPKANVSTEHIEL